MPADSSAAAVRAQQVYLAFSDGELRASSARSPVPSAPVSVPRGLPPALAGKLRPFEPLAVPRAKHLATFKDHRDNIWVFLNNPPANMFSDESRRAVRHPASVATLAPAGEPRSLSHFGLRLAAIG